MDTASRPVTIGNGANSSLHGTVSQPPLPSGLIAPAAITPAHQPSANGVITLETLNTKPNQRCTSGSSSACARSTNPAPRKIMPSRIRLSGANSPMQSAANAFGKAVNKTVIRKIIQT